MATVVTVLSSGDEDDDDIQFIGEKPAEFRAAITLKREEEIPSKDDRDKMKRIFPTLISTSVTITKVDQESPASPTDDRANCEKPHHVSDDSDDDIICLDEEIRVKQRPKESKETKLVKSEAKDSQSITSDDIICLDDEVIPKKTEDSKFVKSEPIDSKPIKSESKDSKLNCDNNEISMPDVIFLDSEDEDEKPTKTAPDLYDEDTNDAAPSAPGSSEAKSDEKSDEQSESSSDSSSVREVSGDRISVFEITDEEGEDDDKAKCDNDGEATGDNKSGAKSDINGSSGNEFSSCEMNEVIANEPSCSVSNEIDKITNGPGNVTEKLLNHLLTKITQVGYTEDNVNCVKRKIMRYYDSSPVEFTQSPEFVDRIKTVISEITSMMERPNSKDITTLVDISDKIKEFLTVFQRQSPHVTAKLQRLYKMYEKLARRIKKLEEQEVDSDSEYENVYVMQARYEKRIVEVYAKICELQNKGTHADRNFKQEFVYSGINGVPVPIQRALEKYYNKTKLFPDFHDVWKLVKKVNESDKLGMKDTQTYNVASTLFTDFGRKLKNRRQYDDFLTITSRLKEDSAARADPAQFDTALQEKLELNKLNRRTEEDVLNEYAMKAAENPAPSNAENGPEDEDKESESDMDGDEAEPGKTFVDSDEEIAALENVDEPRRRTESDEGPPAKKNKHSDSKDSVLPLSKEDESTEKQSDPSTKDGFLETCGLQPS